MTDLKSIHALVMFIALSVSGGVHADNAYETGQAEAMEYRYAKALASYREAAAQGNHQAQLIVGGMLLYCERLYGAEVPCDRAEAVKWLGLAAAQGSEVSRYLLRRAGSAP